ncbi:hypothetical protein T05_11138 [Trichinella murrelli]|uniref:Uncharacterized protein n=1 Tax=Trichinella murrelli TaxID=144512 RepID=A0A0V0U2Z7_9BILA|nr:hypothetical protein T05_11138 [Trichinella murrelli]
MDTEIDSVIINTGRSRGGRGTLSTNLEACPSAACRVETAGLRGYTRPVMEIYDELASNASTSLETAAHFPMWDQARHTMYNRRARKYPRLSATRQELQLTAEHTTTKSDEQFLMYHSPINDILIFATEAGVRLLTESNCWCGDGTFKIVPSWKDLPMYSRIFEVLLSKAEELGAQLDPAKFFWDFETNLIPAIQGNFPNIRVQALAFLPVNLVPAGFEIINVGTSNQLEALFRYFQREWLPTNKISLWNVHGVSMRINNYMEGKFLQLIIDEQGKTETVVRQIDDDYTREMGFVRRSAAYGVQQ